MSVPPDPEVPARHVRRRFTTAYKLEVLRKVDACTRPGELGALLRREGLYSSHLGTWRRQREHGLMPKKRGRKPTSGDPRLKKLAREKAALETANRRPRLSPALLVLAAEHLGDELRRPVQDCRAGPEHAGAKAGGFAHNSGEGGLSPYHLEPGGDLIWQIGTGYFGCRKPDGRFDPDRFRDQAAHDAVRMIEVKLSQGAKPGHGGVLPGPKVSEEIAAIRGVTPWQTVFSPPGHSMFSTPEGLLEFVARLRDLAGGKPVGFKLYVGLRVEFLTLCKAMRDTGITPDFITVDGGEGGTGAAPLEFANSVGMPARDGWMLVNNALTGLGLRDRAVVIASGKILTGFHMVCAIALGADVCVSARGMMLALGCIQALRCNSGRCPTGITTQHPALVHGLDVEDKTLRVARFQAATLRSLLELLGAMGLSHPRELDPHHIYRRVSDAGVRTFAQTHECLSEGALLADDRGTGEWHDDWRAVG